MVLGNLIDDAYKFVNIMLIDANLHPLSAQHIRRPYQHWILKSCCHLFSLSRCIYGFSLWSWNVALFQNLVKQFPILCSIHILCRCSPNWNPHFHQIFGQLDGCLSAKLYNCSIWSFQFHNRFHIFWSQRFKI